jgi:hypothetical protein
MKKIALIFLMFGLSSMAFADSIEIPIVVEGETYTTTGDYYYTYSGHRCYVSEQTKVYTTKGVVITSKSGPQLYCYPIP